MKNSIGFRFVSRVIISILYTIIEFARQINDETDEEWTNFQRLLKNELCIRFISNRSNLTFMFSVAHPNDNDELFASTLYHAVCAFCNAPSPPLPIRKLLLLLWKVLLVRILVLCS